MTASLHCIKNQIDSLTLLLQSFLPLANSHMVDYFSKSLFNTAVPDALQKEILSIGFENTLNLLLNHSQTAKNVPNLYNYINITKGVCLYNLTNVCLSKSQLSKKFSEWKCDNIPSLKLKVFVKEKKSHEIEILTKVIASIYIISKTTHIIDVGDGKGYLSSLLALHHHIPVLGVDASLVHTDSAAKRVGLLEKAWRGLKINPEKSVPSSHNTTITAVNHLYKQVTKFVTEDTDFEELIENIFLEKSSNFGLVGLHTCGDLASACVKIFNKNKSIKSLCNVSCCYHLLSEGFLNEDSKLNYGFPLSMHLKHNKYKLGRTALMLSAQSVDRILDKQKLPSKIIFYRSILEIVLENYKIPKDKRQVGKIKKKCDNFAEYAQLSLKNINVNLDISNNDLMELFNSYKMYETQLNIFFLLRCMLAPMIESIILLDKLLFLHENGHTNAFLVQLFDPIISPRCYGLIALKQ